MWSWGSLGLTVRLVHWCGNNTHKNNFMVALAYISRNELFGWVLNIQSNNRITNFPASVPKFLLDGNYISTKHWSIYEYLYNPIQISCIREYPGDDMIN